MPILTNNKRIYFAGESDSPLKSKSNSSIKYDEIKLTHNSPDNLFEDIDFPATTDSIGPVADVDAEGNKRIYSWLRPHELCKRAAGLCKPSFATVQDAYDNTKIYSETDVRQGGLGDCYYLSAITQLTRRRELLEFVIPGDNYYGFEEENYCGAFHFRFFDVSSDKWVDIVIDDRLPAYEWGDKMKVAFTSITCVDFEDIDATNTVSEFWPALIEKAFAKFYGSYAKIEGGYASQALENFTGGFSEILDFDKSFDDFKSGGKIKDPTAKYDYLRRRILHGLNSQHFIMLNTRDASDAYKNGVLNGYTAYRPYRDEQGKIHEKRVGYKFNPETNKMEDDPANVGLGLISPPHAYAILDARNLARKDGAGSYCLLKVKNPHAYHEWCGPFSDNDDRNWSLMEQDLRKKSATTGSTNIDEGIFWIYLKDAMKYFGQIEFCLVGLDDGTKLTSINGVWPASLQSNSINNAEYFVDVQRFTGYKFEVNKGLASVEIPKGYENKCLVAFTLILNGYHSCLDPVPIFCYYLYKVNDENQPIKEIYNTTTPIFGPWNIARECSKLAFIDSGTYIIIPRLLAGINENAGSSYLPEEFIGKDIHYTLRIFTENETSIEKIPPQQ